MTLRITETKLSFNFKMPLRFHLVVPRFELFQRARSTNFLKLRTVIQFSFEKKSVVDKGCASGCRRITAWVDAINRDTWLGSLEAVAEAPW